jgi:hypothetical protein
MQVSNGRLMKALNRKRLLVLDMLELNQMAILMAEIFLFQPKSLMVFN